MALRYPDQEIDANNNEYAIRGTPLIPKGQRDEQSDFLTEELKALPSFRKCDKAIREKYQKSKTLGKLSK